MRARTLQAGDIVNVDVTAYYKGYHGDLNETFVVGEVDEESKKLTKVAYEVQIWHHIHSKHCPTLTLSWMCPDLSMMSKCRGPWR